MFLRTWKKSLSDMSSFECYFRAQNIIQMNVIEKSTKKISFSMSKKSKFWQQFDWGEEPQINFFYVKCSIPDIVFFCDFLLSLENLLKLKWKFLAHD